VPPKRRSRGLRPAGHSCTLPCTTHLRPGIPDWQKRMRPGRRSQRSSSQQRRADRSQDGESCGEDTVGELRSLRYRQPTPGGWRRRGLVKNHLPWAPIPGCGTECRTGLSGCGHGPPIARGSSGPKRASALSRIFVGKDLVPDVRILDRLDQVVAGRMVSMP
jgi:hypothetical protein